MDSDASLRLVLCGKSSTEVETALRLRNTNALKLPEGIEASVLLQSDTEHCFKDCPFDFTLFMNTLSTRQFGRFLVWSPRLPSTQDFISDNFQELPVGAVCVADVQIMGREYKDSVWVSPRGGLMYTFTLQRVDGRLIRWLNCVVALAITEAVKDLCSIKGLPCIDLRIQWPCYIYLNGINVGGIMCTSYYRRKKFNTNVGVGLNVDNEQPTTCLNRVLKDISPASDPLRREEIMAAFFNKFEMLYDRFIQHGFKCLEELFYKTWLQSEQRVIVRERKEKEVMETSVTIEGLTPSGDLLAIGDDDNEIYELRHNGSSRTDFLQGLVRRKL